MNIYGEWCKGCKHLELLVDNPQIILDQDVPCFGCSINVIDHGIPTGWELGIGYYLEVQRLRESLEPVLLLDTGSTTRM